MRIESNCKVPQTNRLSLDVLDMDDNHQSIFANNVVKSCICFNSYCLGVLQKLLCELKLWIINLE